VGLVELDGIGTTLDLRKHMGLFDKLKNIVKPEPAKAAESTPVKQKTSKKNEKSAKDIATEKGEPWVSVTQVELDPDNIGNGAFELDWNEKFIVSLVRAGYQGKTDQDIVDRWFQDVCRNVVLENYEQWEANQPMDGRPRVIDRRDLGDGRTEVS
jgi:hypothetical protein